jgi:hypothetical protein
MEGFQPKLFAYRKYANLVTYSQTCTVKYRERLSKF